MKQSETKDLEDRNTDDNSSGESAILTRDQLKTEAQKWMELMKVNPKIINRFIKDDQTMIATPDYGYCILSPTEQEELRQMEAKYDIVVYMIIRAYTNIGTLDSFLYVSKYPDEWEMEREDIKSGIVMTYTINREDSLLSDWGSIAFYTDPYGMVIRYF